MPAFTQQEHRVGFSVGDWRGVVGKADGECKRLGYRLGGVGARGGVVNGPRL